MAPLGSTACTGQIMTSSNEVTLNSSYGLEYATEGFSSGFRIIVVGRALNVAPAWIMQGLEEEDDNSIGHSGSAVKSRLHGCFYKLGVLQRELGFL